MSPVLLPDNPHAFGEPLLTGVLRQLPGDFQVEELLGFEPEGEGEHEFLFIEKSGLNTAQVAERLARLATVPVRQVSYAGLKDRHALTRQWFSVHLPGRQDIDWSPLNCDQLTVVRQTRHLRKLRRGAHRGNQFLIAVNQLQGLQDSFPERLAAITRCGVPNYFGEQRFGRNGMNLQQAHRWFAGEIKPGRQQRGFYLSAARSFLFNQVLAQRVKMGSWLRLLGGELLMLQGSRSLFSQKDGDNLQQRLDEADIHLTGPMHGRPGGLQTSDAVAELEQSILAKYPDLLAGLEGAGLKSERRALRVIPADLQGRLSADRAELSFSLPSGCFATAVVRELVNYSLANNQALLTSP